MAKNRDIERLSGYVDAVLLGELPSCRYVIKAVERFRDDLTSDELYFDEKVFAKFCRFAREFKHYKGELAGQHFDPEPWQLFVFGNIVALKERATGLRKYRYADIYVPRKNGKTFMAAILAAWFLLMDGESGPEVYTAAVDKDQAKLCYDASAALIEESLFSSMIKNYRSRSRIECPGNSGVFKPLSKDTKNKDGLNISAAICDERHAWPNTEIYDVIKTGMGARRQPMLISISTAGTDTSNPYFADVETYKDIMLGIKGKENHFLMLYCPDEGDSYDDPAVWAKVNPNLGVSLSTKYMEDECAEAKLRGGTYLTAFQTKNLNMWVDAPDVWISDDDVVACNSEVDWSAMKGHDCYVGIDLASKTDVTAVAAYFPGISAVRYLFIVPEAKVQEMEDRVDYRLWAAQGWLTVAPGKTLDEDWFIGALMDFLEPYRVKCLAYDPWGMWSAKEKLLKYHDVLMPYQQSIKYMSVPTKELETMVLQRKINFGDNPIIRWMMRNVVVYHDPNDNIKLDKARSRNKIDGVVATVDAVGGWLIKKDESRRIYRTHLLRTLSI